MYVKDIYKTPCLQEVNVVARTHMSSEKNTTLILEI